MQRTKLIKSSYNGFFAKNKLIKWTAKIELNILYSTKNYHDLQSNDDDND